MIGWLKKNKPEALALVLIIALALFLRLYRIDQFLTFLGDEGRDVRIVRDLITKGDLVFIGPQTSVGNMYLGPLYYYLMAPALWLAGLSPVGPAVMVAILGTLTVGLTWFTARRWFGRRVALLSAVLYSLSPVAITYSRTSWNPNPLPLFALLTIWGIFEVWQKKKYFWLPFVGAALAFAVQMHYLGLLLFPTLAIFWFLSLRSIGSKVSEKKSFLKQTLFAVVVFLFLMSPLVLFDLKHQGMNTKALLAMLSAGSGVFDIRGFVSATFSLLSFTWSSLIFANEKPSLLISALLIASITGFFLLTRGKPVAKLLLCWLSVCFLGLSLYNQPVYIHYLGLVYPAVFLISGALLGKLIDLNHFPKIISFVTIALLIFINLRLSPAFGVPANQLNRTETVADLIIKEANGQPFNLGLIAERNYDESYRYFLENKNSTLVKDPNQITAQLFVICEDGESCRPEGHSQYQIAVFGVAHIEDQWTVDHIKVYRLVHSR